jgi:hypothetical protein
VRGTIESVDGPTYLIKARDGAEPKVALADKVQIAAVVKASLADIKQGLFVGVTAMPQADGSLSASKCTFSLRRCVGPEKGTTHGIFGPRAQ